MKYFLIAGEASGDIHGSQLMIMLKKHDPNAEFAFWGGDQMASADSHLLKHISELAFMGFLEVFMNIFTILRNFRTCKKQILGFNPDTVILIDYPGFNLRIAEFAKKAGFKVIYYISPTVWAWKKSRINTIRKYVDKMIVILPFEKEFYKINDYNVWYEGHPLIDFIERKINDIPGKNAFIEINELDTRPVVALLPGSRKQELKKLLGTMLSVIDEFKDYQFVIAGTSSIDNHVYNDIIRDANVRIIYDQTYALLTYAEAAIVTSGTATLETAIFGVPEMVCYKTSKFSFFIGKLLVDIKYFSLVNLIMDKPVVKEYLQSDVNKENFVAELNRILSDDVYRKEMIINYSTLKEKLGKPGVAERIAKIIIT